jgi:hypothetical protein
MGCPAIWIFPEREPFLTITPRKEAKMKRINALLGIVVAAILLAGCATTGARSMEGEAVKCPACGFEFNQPSEA